ncbi:hypothetical protein [Nocardia donostiensis]|uniref:Secreted protein n=1 Tax=Nocardia donostiensis TaxID=1538463 RepID=A0A1V2TJ18_9NOCA|nr:hypothetical protein [Nocardia donostiensis]ONM49517.1 hypothetical protein B0T46_06545 [Nocardia donostiensis]OQS13503.1 hypothetical protein B0T36_19025 [Nocardia donostiensis]OQS19994.1 hypothetical protein B0T44_12220 [Nocardia donostiensis]
MTRSAADRVEAMPEPAATPEPSSGSGRKLPVRPHTRMVRERLDPAKLRLFAQSSPGRLIGVGLLLTCLCLAAGAVTAATVNERQLGLDVLLTDTEPDAHAAHRLYTSLSVADAAASTAFISGGLEPETVRNRYSQALGEAGAELVTLTGNNGDDARLRTGIGAGLPVYSGLVETARANNRSGYPVGAAYLSEASNQMQNTLLPMAEQLHQRRADAVDSAQRHHVRPPWLAVLLLLLALAALVWAQLLLAERWHRMFNPGLLLASGAMLILLAWTVVAGSISAASMVSGREDGAAPSARLTESRILAQQARSAETLKLVRRDATGEYDRIYDAKFTRLTELLTGHDDQPSTAARAALERWRKAHDRMNAALDRGDFTAAAAVATGRGKADATAQVEALDRILGAGITETRENLRDNISQSARVLDYLTPGALVLAIAAAGYTALGIWPRLREYR